MWTCSISVDVSFRKVNQRSFLNSYFHLFHCFSLLILLRLHKHNYRFLNHLKRKIGNKARVEGSICNAYLTEEISNFCSNYFQPSVDTKTRDLGRNVNADVESPADNDEIPELFTVDKGRVSNLGKTRYLDDKELERAHLFVLRNTGILGEYERYICLG